MIAGTDTTSSTFRSILLALHQHPECTQKIFSSSSASPGKVDVRYLQALIRETIRLYHAPASFFPRIIPVGGVTLPDGTKFPAGTEVTVQPWALHRSKKGAFGEDAEEFRPERWLVDDEEKEGETEKERVRRLEKDTFMWGYGSRTCLGRSIAELELLAGMTKVRRSLSLWR